MEVKEEPPFLPDNEQANLPSVDNVVKKTLPPKQFLKKLHEAIYGKDYARSSNKIKTDLFPTAVENKAFKIFLQATWAEHKMKHPELEINLREFMSVAQSKWQLFGEKEKKTFFQKVRRKPLPGVPMFARKMVSRSRPPYNSAGTECSVNINQPSSNLGSKKLDDLSSNIVNTNYFKTLVEKLVTDAVHKCTMIATNSFKNSQNTPTLSRVKSQTNSDETSSNKVNTDWFQTYREINAYKMFQQTAWAEHKIKHPKLEINLSEFMALAQSKWQEFGEEQKKTYFEKVRLNSPPGESMVSIKPIPKSHTPTNNSAMMESSVYHNKVSSNLGIDNIDDLPRKRQRVPKKQVFRQMIPDSDLEINKSIDIVTRVGDSDFELNKSIDLVIKMIEKILPPVIKSEVPSDSELNKSIDIVTSAGDSKFELNKSMAPTVIEKIPPPITKPGLPSIKVVPRSSKRFKSEVPSDSEKIGSIDIVTRAGDIDFELNKSLAPKVIEKIPSPIIKSNLPPTKVVPRSTKKFRPPQFIKKGATINENDKNSLNVSMNSLPSKTSG